MVQNIAVSSGFRVLTVALILIIMSAAASPVRAATGAGPDSYGYTAGSIPIVFEDLSVPGSGATTILHTADDDGATEALGFPFVFYGVSYTTISISSNGILTFGGIDTDWDSVDFTTSGPAGNLPTIAPFWHDWTFQYFGSDAVYFVTLGSPGNRRFVVHWSAALSHTGPGNDTVNFEAKLFEGSNNIEFHYDDATVSDDTTVSNGRDATVGVRDINGQTNNRNLRLVYNQAVINDNTAIRIVAPQFKVKSITRPTNLHIILQCQGVPSMQNKIEATGNLTTTPFAAITPTAMADSNGNFQFEDANAGTFTRRFYRVAIPK